MPATLLIIEQGFLKPRGSKPVHGVEIFRLNLIRQLVERGIKVTAVVERSWERRIESWFESQGCAARPRVISGPPIAGVPGAGLIGIMRAARRARPFGGWDTVMFGNARLGMVPVMYYTQWMGLAKRSLLFAHRDPGSNFLDAVSTLQFDVVANSEWVAAWYRGQVNGRVDVCYGLANAERFYPGPRQEAEAAPDSLIHFCLLGRLPNISKGQEKAIAAFQALPPAVRSRCRLHLASFASPPEFFDPCIMAHPWMAAEKVGDFLRGMDVMLTISTHETFSQAIVQGMLTGLPIIASELPVFVEKLDALGPHQSASAELRHGGYIARNVQQVTEAMITLASDRYLRQRLGQEGRKVALDRYVWDSDPFIRTYLFPESRA